MNYSINSTFIIDSERNEVSFKNQKTRIAPKHMGVLLMLIESAPNPVTREHLLSIVWKDTIVVEETLTRAISELRKVFQESSKAPEIIKTVPKKGYYLNANIQKLGLEKTVKVRKEHNYLLYAGMFLCFILILIAFNAPSNKAISEKHILELSSRFQDEHSPSLSKNNQYLLFAEDSTIRIKNLANEISTSFNAKGDVLKVEWINDDILFLVKNKNFRVYRSKKDGSFKHIIYTSDKKIKLFERTTEALYIIEDHNGANNVVVIEKNNFTQLYTTKNTIKSIKSFRNNIYILETHLNRNQIINPKTNQILYTSYDTVHDFEPLPSDKILLSKEQSLTLYNNNNHLEKVLIHNLEIFELSVNESNFLSFTNKKPISNLYQNSKKIFSTKRLEFFPVENDRNNQLAFISTRCGFYNIWLADLSNSSVVRKTFYKEGYIHDFTWDFNTNTIHYIHYIKNKRYIKSIHLSDDTISKPYIVPEKFDELIPYEGKIYTTYENKNYVFDPLLIKFNETKKRPYKIKYKGTVTSKIEREKSDIFGLNLNEFL